MFIYQFSLHSLTFLKKNSMECAKALALQGKPPSFKKTNFNNVF